MAEILLLFIFIGFKILRKTRFISGESLFSRSFCFVMALCASVKVLCQPKPVTHTHTHIFCALLLFCFFPTGFFLLFLFLIVVDRPRDARNLDEFWRRECQYPQQPSSLARRFAQTSLNFRRFLRWKKGGMLDPDLGGREGKEISFSKLAKASIAHHREKSTQEVEEKSCKSGIFGGGEKRHVWAQGWQDCGCSFLPALLSQDMCLSPSLIGYPTEGEPPSDREKFFSPQEKTTWELSPVSSWVRVHFPSFCASLKEFLAPDPPRSPFPLSSRMRKTPI